MKGDSNNHNCNTCNSSYPISFKKGSYYNCYSSCNGLYYFDNNNNYHCLQITECPKDYNKIIRQKNQCTDDCKKISDYQYEFRKECFNRCPNGISYESNDISYFCEVNIGAPRMEDYMITDDHFILMIDERYFVYLDGYYHVLDNFDNYSEEHRYTIKELRIPEELSRKTVLAALRAAFQTYKLNVSYFDDIDIEQAMENIELYIDKDSEKQTDV